MTFVVISFDMVCFHGYQQVACGLCTSFQSHLILVLCLDIRSGQATLSSSVLRWRWAECIVLFTPCWEKEMEMMK